MSAQEPNIPSLPVDLDSLPQTASDSVRQSIDALNLQFQDLKQSLKQLQDEKGPLSREIGALKKQGQDASDQITKMQEISAELKAKKSQLSELNQQCQTVLLPCYEEASAERPTHPGYFRQEDAGFTTQAPEQYDVKWLGRDEAEAIAPKWNQFVDRHPGACAYHRFEFFHLVLKAFGHEPIYVYAQTESGEIVGVLPAFQLNSALFGNFVVSLPFFNYAGPLGDSEEIEEALIAKAVDATQRLDAESLELRDTRQRNGYPTKTEKVSMVLSLPESSEQLWQDVGTKVRAQIKKAASYDLTEKVGGAELLDDFYEVFAQNMRDLGTPVYAKRFFACIFETLEKSAVKPKLVLVYRHQKPISAGFLLGYKDGMEIPWASTVRSANRLNANMFLYWNILKHTADQGYGYFDFGRSSQEASTFQFKKQWGAQPQQLYWHYWLPEGQSLPELNPNNPKYKLMIAVWQRLPVWLTKIIGPPVVKNLP